MVNQLFDRAHFAIGVELGNQQSWIYDLGQIKVSCKFCIRLRGYQTADRQNVLFLLFNRLWFCA